MNHVSVKEIIGRYFEHHNSKFIWGGRRQNMDYYYNSKGWDWYIDFAGRTGSEILGRKSAPNHAVFSFVEENKKPGTETDLLVKLRTDANGDSILEFYPIIGLRLKKQYGRPALRVDTTKLPIFNYTICHESGGIMFWKSRTGNENPLRFTWWLNRLLRENQLFRKVFVDILMAMGGENKILKDIARTIESDHFFLPPITIEYACRYHNPDQLIRSIVAENLPVNFNRWNLNAAWYAASMVPEVDMRDRGILLNIPREKFLSFITLKDLFSGPDVVRFAEEYYADKLCYATDEEDRVRTFARDYGHIASGHPEGLSLRKNSIRTLEEIHDEEVRRMMAVHMRRKGIESALPIVPPEKSAFLQLRKKLPEEFKWLTTSEDLFQEGEIQGNCVFSYWNAVRRDKIAIYHWEIEDRQYTIEFTRNGNGFEIAQMMQRFNRPALKEDINIVRNLI